jgi:hypothetical protein
VAAGVAALLAFLICSLLLEELPLYLVIAVMPLGIYVAFIRPIYPVLLLAVAPAAAGLFVRRRTLFRLSPLDAPVFLLLAFTAVSCLWSQDKLDGLRMVLQVSVDLLLVVLPRFFIKDVRSLKRATVCWVVVSAFLALVSAVVGRSPKQEGRYGLGDIPNIYAAYLGATLFLALGVSTGTRKATVRMATFLGSIPVAVVFLLTQSRAALLSVVAGLTFLFVRWKDLRDFVLRHWLQAAVAIGGCLLVLSVGETTTLDRMQSLLESPSQEGSLQGRLVIWRLAREQFTGTYGWGCGAGCVRDPLMQGTLRERRDTGAQAGQYYAHSYWLQVSAELGITGLAINVWLVWAVTLTIRRRLGACRPGDESMRSLLYGMSGALVALLLHSLVDLDPTVRSPWLIMGFASAAYALAPEASDGKMQRRTTSTWPALGREG